MTSPDADSFDGTHGESYDRELFLANEQSALAGQIDGVQTGITLVRPAFRDGDLVIVGQEVIKIVMGGGTCGIAVERGYGGTAAIPHEAGSKVYTACDYTDIVVAPVDISGTDESDWCTLAMRPEDLPVAIPGDPVYIGDKPYSETVPFMRRFTVPAETPLQIKRDVKLRASGIAHPIRA